MKLQHILLAAALFIASAASSAFAFDVVNLWPSTPPGDKPEQYQENGGSYYTPRLEFWRPENQTTDACIIVSCGGCYNGVAYDVEGVMPRDYFLSKGVAVVMLWYRTPRREGVPKHYAAWQDVQRAVRISRANAEKWNIDPNKIGEMGFSAGGHLCLMAATSSMTQTYEPVDELDKLPCNVNFAIPVYPAYALTDGVDGENTGKGVDAELVDDFQFDEQTCPMCFIHGDGDGYSAMASMKVYQQLKRMGIPGEVHIYAYANHAFFNCGPEAPIRKYPQRVYEWMQTIGILETPENAKVEY
ncbi:MAG: alpha/beta hydrolase [Thermoguttaceae bacterium]|jgi:acetyl esterase/lipase|nr:alpha/beta hydrolase [Thermoguttaceae bacterium]